ncbi:hypothetical protein HDK77DRAFT_104190 [Phyllosticta capitalensis]|uniref:Transmembrane protein n=1 Tax=Phyllosticta capitalensis TaxID=121624 RepID=A0ABR1YB39_9PEZI
MYMRNHRILGPPLSYHLELSSSHFSSSAARRWHGRLGGYKKALSIQPSPIKSIFFSFLALDPVVLFCFLSSGPSMGQFDDLCVDGMVLFLVCLCFLVGCIRRWEGCRGGGGGGERRKCAADQRAHLHSDGVQLEEERRGWYRTERGELERKVEVVY